MDFANPSFLLGLVIALANFIGFLAVLNFKDKNRDKELDAIRLSIVNESERLKKTKGELYNRVNLVDGEIIGLTRDISHVREGLSESNNRLNNSIADFKMEMVKSEARITSHMDQALGVMKDSFRDAVSAVANSKS